MNGSHVGKKVLKHVVYAQACDLYSSGELRKAEEAIDQLLAAHPSDRDGLNLKAIICASQGRINDASTMWQRMLQDSPEDAQILLNLGRLHQMAQQFIFAEEFLKRSVLLNPGNALAFINLAAVYVDMQHYDDALTCCSAALKINPQLASAHFNAGTALQGQLRLSEAHQAYKNAVTLDPEYVRARSNAVFTQHYLNQFDPELNLKEACRLGQSLAAIAPKISYPNISNHERNGPLRIGLVSADLRSHPVGYFLQKFVPELARKNCALFAYYNGQFEDELSRELGEHCHGWRLTVNLSDSEMAYQIVADQLDILIDLSGHTAGNRLACLSTRLAPVQMSWLGYFSTTGIPTIDYVIADPFCVPVSEERFFSERIVRLPNCRYCFSPSPHRLENTRLPSQVNGYVTLGCYQALAKISESVLRCWAQILDAVGTARLRLQSANFGSTDGRKYLTDKLDHFGISLDRVDLVEASPYEVYLRSYSMVDVLLDTFPYPGGTTTLEALWLGVPTLTLATPGMLGRQGMSIMENAGLQTWVCRDEEEYVEKAISLAKRQGPLWQQVINLRLTAPEHVRKAPIYDAEKFAADFYALMEMVSGRNTHTPKAETAR